VINLAFLIKITLHLTYKKEYISAIKIAKEELLRSNISHKIEKP